MVELWDYPLAPNTQETASWHGLAGDTLQRVTLKRARLRHRTSVCRAPFIHCYSAQFCFAACRFLSLQIQMQSGLSGVECLFYSRTVA